MRAIILAAGKGSRLRPHTSDTPKPLTPLVEDTTILDYNLHTLDSCGVSEVIIVVGYLAEDIEAHVSELDLGPDIRCVMNEAWDSRGPMGSFIRGIEAVSEEPFLLLNGDTIYEETLLQSLTARNDDGIALAYSPVSETSPDEMKVVTEDGTFQQVGKDTAPTDAISAGLIMVRSGETFATLRNLLNRLEEGAVDISELYWHDVLNRMHSGGVDIQLVEVPSDAWWEIDTPEDLEETVDHLS